MSYTEITRYNTLTNAVKSGKALTEAEQVELLRLRKVRRMENLCNRSTLVWYNGYRR